MHTYAYLRYISPIILVLLFLLSGGKFSNHMSFLSFLVGCLMMDQMLMVRYKTIVRRILVVLLVMIQGFQMTLWIKNLHNFMFIMMVVGLYTILFLGYWKLLKYQEPSKLSMTFYYITCISMLVLQHVMHNPFLIIFTGIIQMLAILLSYLFSKDRMDINRQVNNE